MVLPIKTESLISKYRREIERYTRLLISDYESIVIANAKKRQSVNAK